MSLINEIAIPSVVTKFCPIFVFHPKEKVLPCSLERMLVPSCFVQQNINDVPIYYFHNETERYVTYILMYEQDLGTSQTGLGGHERDIEFVRVYYDENVEIKRVYFSAHSSDQGSWVDPSKLVMDGDRFLTYVSLSSHAMYPSHGIIFRIFCFANDVCADQSKEGRVWDPVSNMTLMKDVDSFKDIPNIGSFMQWSYKTQHLKGIKGPAWLRRLIYPLFK